MKIYIAADHNGFEMKNQLAEWLKAEGYEVTDMGPETFDQHDDYPDYGIKVAQEVAKDPKNHYGILLCGSGVGMSVVADKVKGIRAAMIHDPEIAKAAQRDDDINVLALGADYIPLDTAKEVITAWLHTPFAAEERFIRRIHKIKEYEDQCLC
jgi:ribose 5-phosphate isomerase B